MDVGGDDAYQSAILAIIGNLVTESERFGAR